MGEGGGDDEAKEGKMDQRTVRRGLGADVGKLEIIEFGVADQRTETVIGEGIEKLTTRD